MQVTRQPWPHEEDGGPPAPAAELIADRHNPTLRLSYGGQGSPTAIAVGGPHLVNMLVGVS